MKELMLTRVGVPVWWLSSDKAQRLATMTIL